MEEVSRQHSFAPSLQTVQDVFIDVSGAENSGKERLISHFLKNKNNGLNRAITIDNEQYNIRLTTSCGQESLIGVSDVRYRTAQGCVFVYNINSTESFELFHSVKESILKAKQTDRFPFLMIGYGSSKERLVSPAEAKRVADRANCKFIEVTKNKEIEGILLSFIKETINFSAIREKELEDESSKGSEQFICVIGDVFTGKTCFIKLASSGQPRLQYTETDVCSPTPWKFTHNNENHSVALMDTPGSSTSYPKELFEKIQGLVLIYSVASRKSFDKLNSLREMALSVKGVSKLPSIMIATKADLPESMWQVSEEEGRKLSEKFGCIQFFTKSLLEHDTEITNSIAAILQEIKRLHKSSMEIFANLDRSGSLNKTSKSLKKLHTKTFIIRDGAIHSTSDGVITPKTTKLPLLEDTTVEMLPTNASNKNFPFEVSNAAGKMFLSATSDEDRSSWIETIVANIAVSTVSATLLEDVVKIMIWEIITNPDILTEPEADIVSPKVDKKLKNKVTSDSPQDGKRGSGIRNSMKGFTIRRKGTLTGSLSSFSKSKKEGK